MEQSRINEKMHELEDIIEYKFKKLSRLEDAMRSVKLENQENKGKNHREYSNEALALLGDTVIKFLITQYLYNKGKRKGEITNKKSELENNKVLHTIAERKRILFYVYNDEFFASDNPPEHKKVCSKKHDPYIEAITAAIYLDGGWEEVDKWFKKWLLPELERQSKEQRKV